MENADSNKPSFDVAVVGAGPAGMMAAIAAAEQGRRVVVLEQLDRPGVKLLATGGGRCNLTNAVEAREVVRRLGRGGPFARRAVAELDPEGLRQFFRGLGVETVEESGGRVYPASQSAATVQQALVGRCRQLGVRFLFRAEVRILLIEGGAVSGLAVRREADAGGRASRRAPAVEGGASAGEGRVSAASVILAAGGRSYPALGGTGGGYALAARAGHAIVPPTPALVGLRTRETWPARCAGISVPAARLRMDLPRRGGAPSTGRQAGSTGPRPAHSASSRQASESGEVLFTHEGLSGPAVLDLSGDVVRILEELRAAGVARPQVPLRLDLFPGTTADEWRQRLEEWRRAAGRRTVRTLLAAHLPARLAAEVCGLCGVVGEVTASQLGTAPARALCEALAGPSQRFQKFKTVTCFGAHETVSEIGDCPELNAPAPAGAVCQTRSGASRGGAAGSPRSGGCGLPLTAVGSCGFESAMVTRGGVCLDEVDGRTLQSRLVKGLFFAGEVLDVDGPCGGFNLQWAFSSGRLAGLSAAG